MYSILSKKKESSLTTILIVDDEKEICRALKGILCDEGYRVVVAHNPEEASQSIIHEKPHLLLLDVWFGKGSWDGVYFLDRVKLSHPFLPIIMISGHATLNLAVTALQKGAYDFLEKPINVDRLLLSVKHALAFKSIQSRLVTHRDWRSWAWPLPIDVKLKKIARSDSPILLVGEEGIGKARLAKYLHLISMRHEGPLVVAGSTMLNSMDDDALFGVQSMGRTEKIGFFEQAQGGTIILTNIHRLTIQRQWILAQLFHAGSIKRMGGDIPIPLNVRFIATTIPSFLDQEKTIASGSDESSMMAKKEMNRPTFSVDKSFYDRLTLSPFTLDPLRKNTQNISIWTYALLEELAQDYDMDVPTLSESAMLHLKKFSWPGNIEQLRNVLQRIMIHLSDSEIDEHHLPSEITADHMALTHAFSLPKNVYSLPLKEARAYFEMSYVKAQLAASEGSVTKAAEVIGMERSALHRKLKMLATRSQHFLTHSS